MILEQGTVDLGGCCLALVHSEFVFHGWGGEAWGRVGETDVE